MIIAAVKITPKQLLRKEDHSLLLDEVLNLGALTA